MVLVAAVRRAKHPGIKYDQMAIFEGPQGKFKSTAIKVMAVEPSWFCDNLPLSGNTQMRMEAMADAWIIEGAELHGMKKGDVADLKSFLSRTDDKARQAYGRTVTRRARKCIIIGTTNERYYLKDSSGNRRFWPVRVQEFNIPKLKDDRDMLWAEAVVMEKNGVEIYMDAKLVIDAEKEQAERQIDANPFDSFLHGIFGNPKMKGKVEQEEVWRAMGFNDPTRRNYAAAANIQECMTKYGWGNGIRLFKGIPVKCYFRGDEETINHVTVRLTPGDIGTNHVDSEMVDDREGR